MSSFEYQDTPDQALVWKEIRQDLEKSQPMYRLLCGDVGFGKTELSIRASFRVVINGGQVLILAPTSVLVNQHFVVFKARLSSFGVVVGLCVGGLFVFDVCLHVLVCMPDTTHTRTHTHTVAG